VKIWHNAQSNPKGMQFFNDRTSGLKTPNDISRTRWTTSRYSVTVNKIPRLFPDYLIPFLIFLPAGLPRSGNLPVLFLLSSQKSTFCPLPGKL